MEQSIVYIKPFCTSKLHYPLPLTTTFSSPSSSFRRSLLYINFCGGGGGGGGTGGDDSMWVRAAGQAHPFCNSHHALISDAGRNADTPAGGRRRLLLVLGIGAIALSPRQSAEAQEAAELSALAASGAPDTTITDKVFFDISLCPPFTRSNISSICKDPEPLGRIVIGLYGKQVPLTVQNFKAMCTGKAGSTYEGTTFYKVIQGQYIQAGRQGIKERGEVTPPKSLDRNLETIDPNAFKLRHVRPGTVSLCLGENDDEDSVKQSSNYRNVEFLITTGPGPVPQLDNGNIVCGTVLEGMDVVASLSALPTYKPSERIRQFNEIAELFGDDRAANARSVWDRPVRAVVISKCGELQDIHPSLAPTLP